MPALQDPVLWLAVAAVFAAGVMRGFSGFGTGLVLAPVLSMLFVPAQAVAVVTCLTLLSGLQVLPGAAREADWRLVAALSAGALLAIPLGAWVLVSLPPEVMRRGIAAVVLVFALILATGWRWQGRRTPGGAAVAGALSGALNGATGAGGPPVLLYMLSGQEGAAYHRANIICFYSFLHTVTLLTLAAGGAVTGSVLARAAVSAPLLFAGVWLGARLFRGSSEAAYRRFALVVLIVIALVGLLSP